MGKFVDLTGQKFGKLTVKKYLYSKNGRRYWLCKCDCGGEKISYTSRLTQGKTKTCGCSKEVCDIKHYNFKGNKWEEQNGCFIGTDAKGNKFTISKEDYEECRKYCWTGVESRNPKNGIYFSARMSRKSPEGHKMKMLHNFVWELHNGKIPDKYIVDHIDRNGSNCCIDNLRLATFSQNIVNKDLTVRNKSGITGVCYDKKMKKWRSFITVNGNRIEFTSKKEKEEAIKLRLEAEAKYFGEFAPQKHLFEEYGIEVNK